MGRNWFPLAVMAAYGPNRTLATKLVVSVMGPHDEEIEVRKWATVAIDVRQDPTIAADVAAFLRTHGVREQVTADRIIGCPHEEGIDYPLGRTCPRCPFWAGIDRFTHEPLTLPAPTMTPAEILEALSQERTVQPREALQAADGHRTQLVEPLLRAIERGVAGPLGLPEPDAQLFAYALYLLAKWREPRAYPLVCEWLSLPGEGAFQIGGDIVTQDGARILAAVCDGDPDPIKTLILNREANEYGRSIGVNALALLAVWAEVRRESVEAYFLWLAREGLEREPGDVWDSLSAACADIEALSAFPDLRRAYEAGLCDPMSMAPSELDDAEHAPRGLQLAETQEQYPPIDDVAEAIAWWASFAKPHDRSGGIGPSGESRTVGRNEPCPCGSGKKYKKCHGA